MKAHRARWEERHRKGLESSSLEPSPLLLDHAELMRDAPHGPALDLACGYGTRPLNILVSALVVIVTFGLVYLVAVSSLNLPQALLVSFKAFTGAQIDTWGPAAGHPLNFLLALESFLGIFVMTVLVVTFSRKVIR